MSRSYQNKIKIKEPEMTSEDLESILQEAEKQIMDGSDDLSTFTSDELSRVDQLTSEANEKENEMYDVENEEDSEMDYGDKSEEDSEESEESGVSDYLAEVNYGSRTEYEEARMTRTEMRYNSMIEDILVILNIDMKYNKKLYEKMDDIVNYINSYLVGMDVNVDIRNSLFDTKIIAVLLVLYELKGDITLKFLGILEYLKMLHNKGFININTDVSVLEGYSKVLKCGIKAKSEQNIKNIKSAMCLDKIIQNKLGINLIIMGESGGLDMRDMDKNTDYMKIKRKEEYSAKRVLPWEGDVLPWSGTEMALIESITNIEDISEESKKALLEVLTKVYPDMLEYREYRDCSEDGCRNRFINNYIRKAKKVVESRTGVVASEREEIKRRRAEIETEKRKIEGDVDIGDIYKRQRGIDSKIRKRFNAMIKKRMGDTKSDKLSSDSDMDELFSNLKINKLSSDSDSDIGKLFSNLKINK